MKEENLARKKKRLGFKECWDRSCTRKKREVHRSYRKWRKGKIGFEVYERARKAWRKLIEDKKKKLKDKEEEEFRRLRNESNK